MDTNDLGEWPTSLETYGPEDSAIFLRNYLELLQDPEAAQFSSELNVKVVDLPVDGEDWLDRDVVSSHSPNMSHDQIEVTNHTGNFSLIETNPLTNKPSGVFRFLFLGSGMSPDVDKRQLTLTAFLEISHAHQVSPTFVKFLGRPSDLFIYGMGARSWYDINSSYAVWYIWYKVPYRELLLMDSAPYMAMQESQDSSLCLLLMKSKQIILPNNLTIYMRYSFEDCSTVSLIFGWNSEKIITQLKTCQSGGGIGDDPFRTHLFYLSAISNEWWTTLAGVKKELTNLEVESFKAEEPEIDALKRRLHNLASNLIRWKSEFEILQHTLCSISRLHAHFLTLAKIPSSNLVKVSLQNLTEESKALKISCAEVSDRVQNLIDLLVNIVNSRTSMQLRDLASSSKKDSTVMAANSDHMRRLADQGQEDSKTMAKIAYDTKRDSTSMKVIAVVTLVYLPTAFVSSIFGMQLVQVEGSPGQEYIKFAKPWSAFVGSAVPLTIVTLGTWFLWVWWSDHKEKVAQSKKGSGMM